MPNEVYHFVLVLNDAISPDVLEGITVPGLRYMHQQQNYANLNLVSFLRSA